MDQQLHLLETFQARGSDGATYKVCAYERMRRDETVQDGNERWLPTGVSEYRLDSGETLDPRADGTMVVPGKGVTLQRLN